MNLSAKKNSLNHILLLGFFLRFAVLLLFLIVHGDFSFVDSPDTTSYLDSATEFLDTGKYTRYGEPDLRRPPGYALFLMPGLLVNHVEIVTILMQIGLSCLTILLVYKIAILVFKNRNIALISALLFAIEPLTIFYTTQMLTETLFAFLITYSIYLLLDFLQEAKVVNILLFGLTLAWAIFVKPAAVYLPFLLIPLILFLLIKNNHNFFKSLVCTIMLVSIPLASVSVWKARNMQVANFSGFSPSGGALYCYSAGSIIAENENIHLYEVHKRLGCNSMAEFRALHPELTTIDQIYAFQRQKGKEIILNNFWKFTIHHIHGIIRFVFVDPGSSEYLKELKLYPSRGGLMGDLQSNGLIDTIIKLSVQQPIVFFVSIIMGLILLFYNLAAIIGIFSQIFKLNFNALLLLSLLVYFVAVHGGSMSVARYRLTFESITCLFAGYGISNFSARLRRVFVK